MAQLSLPGSSYIYAHTRRGPVIIAHKGEKNVLMKIKRESLPPGEDKTPTALTQSLLQTKTVAKKRCVGTTYDRTYRSGKKNQGSFEVRYLVTRQSSQKTG